MKPYEYSLSLMAKAAEDEAAVDALTCNPRIADAIVGFHCQQAAEKMLKAVLTAAGGSVPKTHDLQELLDLLASSGLTVPPEVLDAWKLTPFAVVLRYPVSSPPPGTLARDEAVSMTRAIRAWAEAELQRLAPPPPVQPDASDTSGGSDP